MREQYATSQTARDHRADSAALRVSTHGVSQTFLMHVSAMQCLTFVEAAISKAETHQSNWIRQSYHMMSSQQANHNSSWQILLDQLKVGI